MAQKSYVGDPARVLLQEFCAEARIPYDLALEAMERLARNNVARPPDYDKFIHADQYGIQWHKGNLGVNEFMWLVDAGIKRIGIEEVRATILKNIAVFLIGDSEIRIGHHLGTEKPGGTFSRYAWIAVNRNIFLHEWIGTLTGKPVMKVVYDLFRASKLDRRPGSVDDMLREMLLEENNGQ